jgi:hypothetical protein
MSAQSAIRASSCWMALVSPTPETWTAEKHIIHTVGPLSTTFHLCTTLNFGRVDNGEHHVHLFEQT